MRVGILGTKVGMTRIRDEKGTVVTVTVVQAGPCTVLQVKTHDRDGYDAVQIGYGDVKPHRSTKPLIGHAGRAGVGPKRALREIRLDCPAEVKEGDVLTVEMFGKSEVGFVDVSGVTKGKGFSGVMRRHGFGGQPGSHGTERKHRSPGAIGGSATRGTGRCVRKGKRMAGHFGNVRCTVRNHRLLGVDAEHHLLLVKGSVPGANGGLLFVQQAKTKG